MGKSLVSYASDNTYMILSGRKIVAHMHRVVIDDDRHITYKLADLIKSESDKVADDVKRAAGELSCVTDVKYNERAVHYYDVAHKGGNAWLMIGLSMEMPYSQAAVDALEDMGFARE